MKTLFICLTLASMLTIVALIGCIASLIKRKARIALFSFAILFMSILTGLWAGFSIANRGYKRFADVWRPRTGVEIYTALFGKAKPCVRVIKAQDQVVPRIDYAIWLHFQACPEELKRILAQHKFKREVISTAHWHTESPNASETWFQPEALGDSILLFTYPSDEYGNGQYIYCSSDSSEVFCKDVAD